MGKKSASRSDTAPSEDHETPLAQTADDQSMTTTLLPGIQDTIDRLESMSEIKNDAGDDVRFVGETKRQFIAFFRDGYRPMKLAVTSIHGLAAFLNEVRAALKPKKLFLTWLHYAGFPVSTAYNYLKLHDKYQEDFPRYSHLGVRRLLAVAQLRDCRTYVKENAVEIASKPAPEVIKDVKHIKEQLKKEKKRKGGGRKRQYEEFGKYKIRRSGNGTKLVIENLTKWEQERIVEAVKLLLSQAETYYICKIPDLGYSDDP